MINLDITNALGLGVTADDIKKMKPEADNALATVANGTGAGNDFLGWTDLPTRLTDDLLDEINEAAAKLRNE